MNTGGERKKDKGEEKESLVMGGKAEKKEKHKDRWRGVKSIRGV